MSPLAARCRPVFAGRLMLSPPKQAAPAPRATAGNDRYECTTESESGAFAGSAAQIDAEAWGSMPHTERELMSDARYVAPTDANVVLRKRKASGSAGQSRITDFLKKRT
jgi:hypothetical protein